MIVTWKITFCFSFGQAFPNGLVPSSLLTCDEYGVHSLVTSLAGEHGVAGTARSI